MTRAIPFSGLMVRAILDGSKTQTRRTLTARTISGIGRGVAKARKEWGDEKVVEVAMRDIPDAVLRHCPYGVVGDRLAVKESAWMWCEKRPNGRGSRGRQKWLYVPLENAPVYYAADRQDNCAPRIDVVSPNTGNEWGWRLKIARFLPRAAVRITLRITAVRVERIADCSGRDAEAEGAVFCYEQDGGSRLGIYDDVFRVAQFKKRWDALNADRGFGWDANPYVWVIEFARAA